MLGMVKDAKSGGRLESTSLGKVLTKEGKEPVAEEGDSEMALMQARRLGWEQQWGSQGPEGASEHHLLTQSE